MANRFNGSSRFYDWKSCCSILRYRMVLHYKQLRDCNSPVEELGHRNQRSKFDNCNTQNISNRESVTSFVEKTSIFKSLAGSVTIASSLAHLDSIFRSLSASLQTASSFSEKNSIFKTLAASITFTMGSMVANVNSGQLTCNSSPHSCSTSLTATWNTASGLAEKSSLSRSLTGSMSLVSTFAEKSSVFRSLTGSLSLVASETKGHARGLSGSLGSSSGLAEKSSLFRSLTGSLSLASSFAEKGSIFRSLSGAWTMAPGFAEKASLFRSLSGSLGVAAFQVRGLATALSASLGLSSGFAEK